MLEGLVAWVLNNYIGKYVENLNTDQLSIALLSGEVELENLPLKREALRHIGLPMEIKAGFIGKVRLQVPVRQIRTASWVIGIEQLYLVAGPINLDEYDSEAEEQAILDYKLSRLEALEARWRADIEHDPGYYASSYSSWMNYGTSLITNIIENLQLNIKDVHIRYEDGVTLPEDNGIAFGIRIGALTAQSCDASWIPGSTSWNLTDASFKLMELDSLSVYWNHVKKDQLFGGLNLGDLAIAMSESSNPIKQNILSPVNARAHIKRDRTERPLRSINKPRIVVDLLLDEVPLFITDIQYEEMVKCIKELDRIDRRKQQWRCRPVVPIKEGYREWWKYAARCHLGRDTLKSKPSWGDVLVRAKENVLYVQAYTKLLGTPTSILPPETKTLTEKVEQERSFDELRVLRELAMQKARPVKSQLESNAKVPQGRGMLEQWFPLWWGWYSKTPPSNNGTQNGGSSTTFDGELLDVLADTIDDDTLLRRDMVFGQFNFALVQGAISLCTAKRGGGDSTKTVIELKFERVNLSYDSRPRSGSHKFSISLGALYLRDFLTENSTFPILVQPQIASSGTSRVRLSEKEKATKETPHHLFELVYEKRPLHVSTDHLLHVYSQSLDVVYNPTVIYWLIDFICKPHRSASPNQRFQAMKRRTRRQLIKNWEQILDGDLVYRSSWDLQFKISAPQILFVESFVDSNAAVVVVDFGKLHLSNDTNLNQEILQTEPANSDDDEEEERFETPCSTPPGSQENGSLTDFQCLSETELHKKLYDQYIIDLVDLQILMGKAKDNWKHVRTRGMSTLHFLERFNISLQVERRVFTTSDPSFPSVTVSGNLPRLVVHVNEQKVGAIRLMYNLLSSFSKSAGVPQTEVVNVAEPESPRREENLDRSLSHAVMVQFIIDQMAFELQSRGRSVAELQVSGVQAALSKRMADLSVSLSVHGLLLVDALQEFGPDFELLVASHKHVGMDSISGSLRDSEPTSPVSPVSPESPDSARPPRLTSPVALTNALSTLVSKGKISHSPRNSSAVGLEKLDSEALIVVELTLVNDLTENLRMANIQFNNLDIIANQETIVELLGFFRRILPLQKSRSAHIASLDDSASNQSTETKLTSTRTEITFDFHRLNVLLMRAVVQDNHLVGQKIATATMTDARIQATLAADTLISGSLGGVQVLDQTPTGKTHQRIISVGRDPLADPPQHPLEHFSGLPDQQPEAFRFMVSRSTRQASDKDCCAEIDLDLTIRVASVWYTHAPHLISELRSCADEFKQYLSNFARQISAAATDMAIGLVNADDWSIPPRKRLPSVSALDVDTANTLSLRLDVLLESPVLVIPRSSHSKQVFVAHLGTMSLRHEPHLESMAKHKVTLEVRDMNLYSLEMSAHTGHQTQSNLPMRAGEMYSCKESGKPILHDTTLKILVEKQNTLTQSTSFLLDGGDFTNNSPPIVQVHGAVITPLRVSLSRGQYEQLLDTINRLFSMPAVTATAAVAEYDDPDGVSGYSEKLDLCVKVSFELPTFSVQLKQAHSEQPLVELSMRDFVVKYEKLYRNESNVQVALRSLLMEDLLCPVGSRHRYMMQSSAPARAKLSTCASKSCPDLAFARQYKNAFGRGSLPDRLETDTLYGAIPAHWRRKPTISSADTPNTPPPSPGGITSEENLVLLSITMTRPEENGCVVQPEDRFYRKMVTVDFNCLDLVISVESWMVVFDFFGIAGLSGAASSEISAHRATPDSDRTGASKVDDDDLPARSETEIEVRSLTLVLTQMEREIAKANVSNASMHILKAEDGKTKISGSLGSMSLLDLTPHGRFYRERFLSSGRKALNFQYSSYADCEDRPHDARLKLEMSAVHYVHTQRFVAELQAFFGHFSQLWSIMRNLRTGAGAIIDMNKRGTRLSLELHAGAPVILLPVSSRSDELILLDLGELTAHNRFDTSTIVPECLLDVMLLELLNMDVYAARRLSYDASLNEDADALMVAGFLVKKMGSSLLTEKCHLKLRVERNLDTYISRDIPDLSIHGILSTMDCALDPAQYMLIRGLLSYNIGENLDDLRLFVQDLSHTVEYAIPADNRAKTWTRSCIILELVNVTVKLHPSHNIAALACINFIKSRLTLDSLSDGSQDIDLVSQEILITDTRFQNEPIDRRCNVFTRILQPLRSSTDVIEATEDRVQAEVHHRKRNAYSATTILLHSMRLTAILDWWEAVRDFLLLNSPVPESIPGIAQVLIVNKEAETAETVTATAATAVAVPFELKINITDSELVIVEDTAISDTNAVILKTTAVLSYRSTPKDDEKPLSCNLSHCELFSCILGQENETALSIIDPVGASLDLTQNKCLEIQLQPLCVRLSYHDVTMFSRMLSSLPKQTLWAKQRSSEAAAAIAECGQVMDDQVLKLTTLGFAETDCKIALDCCDGQLDDAALWLTQNAMPTSPTAAVANDGSVFRTIELQASCMRICIIDDCRDADVPLLEITLADFSMRKVNQQPGLLSAVFGVDYYNRVLSGWEPFVEPWRANIQWEQKFTSSFDPRRLYVSIDSQDSVNVNVTLTLVELVQLVKHNWTQDYYLSNGGTAVGRPAVRSQLYRRRSPFIPFALKNDTGCRLWFKTFIATTDDTIDKSLSQAQVSKDDTWIEVSKDDTWIEVSPGDTTPFTFEERGKLRHHATHIVRRHQIAVLVEGWKAVDPVTVDRVGIYFRHANADTVESQLQVFTSKARVVFAIELEGSARKLVTVRSALQISNKLANPIEIKMEKSLNQLGYLSLTSTSTTGRTLQVPAQSVISVPLTHTGVQMCFKPFISNYLFQYCTESVDWTVVKKPLEVTENYITCRTNQNNIFRMCVAVRRNNYPLDGIQVLPAHMITVMAPVTLTNLLPYELMYEAGEEGGRIAPGSSADLHCANLNEQLEITITLDGYPISGTITLPPNSCSYTARIKLLDPATRMLCLQAAVVVEKGSAVQINITAPYWLINKTGLPLVFRQEGVGIEAAGQFEEHERARMVAPLLFSFSDEEASRTLSVRVGTEVHPYGIPQWSQHFHLQPGIHVHRLRISLRDGRPDIVYLISVATRAARGRYRATTVVTLSPRYQLHNKSSCTLELAQKCFTTTVFHPDAQATYITTMPDCHMPFHWPRLDKDLLLCVRITNVPDCMWSGGIRLDDNYSLTINVRDVTGKMHFLRVDVVLQETTYFIVFTDADTMPPPIRVDNFSEVPLLVNQIGIPDNLQWTVRPHSSVPYALDEPIQAAGLILTAPGGVTASYDLNVLGEGRGLTYENFIYIAFTGTFKTDSDLGNGESDLDPLDVETQRLVLEAGAGGWVALRRKQYGDRAQLWRMTGDGQLQHEGSSPPRDKHSKTPDTIYVLDIAGTAPQPFTYCALALRKPDSRRRSTQTWRFTDDGRLCCAHKNMCVQSKDGFMGLCKGGSVARWQMWSEAVLGPTHDLSSPPIEQRVGRQKLRPGSGFLSVRVTTDGPTRVLQVLDIKERKKTFALLEERDWSHIAVSHRPIQIDANVQKLDSSELDLNLDLSSGLGLSIVSQRPVEELLFARLAGISLNLVQTPFNTTLDLSVADVQIDNQLFEAQCTSVLFVSRSSRTEDEFRPALHVAAEKLQSKNQNAEIYKHVIVSVKPLCMHLEEKFILKLAAFLGIGKSEMEVPVDENDFKAQRFISEVSAAHAKRYYFGALKLVPNQVKLSVLTTTKLPHHLQAVKRKLGLTLINFENATIELEPFVKKHPFESSQFLMHSIVKHYKDELKWQAAVILGSVDFLGNPLGFMNDVTEGVSGLIYEGSVKSLVKNVTHGISNSAAKVTESLSDGLGRVIMDERHEEARQRIRANTTGSSDHLVAGLKGFGFGLLGGVTSIFKQTYDGATNEGFPGFFAGFGRGVVGTITKPVVGVLDLATETASAVRETSRSAHRAIPQRDRPPRVVSGSTGLLPPYNRQQAEGQEFLYSINNRDYSELFVAYECLCSGSENLKVLVSNEQVRVISGGTKAVVTQVNLADLLRCQPMQKPQSNNVTLYYIELLSRFDSSAAVNLDGVAELLRRPKVRCDNEEVAKRVSQQINYAKGMHEERSLTLSSSDNMLDDVEYYK